MIICILPASIFERLTLGIFNKTIKEHNKMTKYIVCVKDYTNGNGYSKSSFFPHVHNHQNKDSYIILRRTAGVSKRK